MHILLSSASAGLRGRMEAGWSRMNDLIVIQASQVRLHLTHAAFTEGLTAQKGLCAYVLENVKEATSKGVVIGHDHRHHSKKWANLTAAAFVAKGMKVYLYDGLVHTPMLAYTPCHSFQVAHHCPGCLLESKR